MKSKTPLIVIILAVTLIIGGIIFVLNYANQNSLLRTKISQEDFIDSDDDGLRDWEEELYRTNPLNPDTDGDGYLDGEEVNSGHNPLIMAPGDKLTFYPIPLGKKYNITQKVLSEETLDSILDSYLSQKGEYIEDHSEIYSPETFSAFTTTTTLQEMFKRAMADSYSTLLTQAEQTISDIPEIFEINITDEDVKISQDNSVEAIKMYLSQVSSFLNSDIFFLQEKSFEALLSAFQDNDFSQLTELIKVNDNKIEKIKEIIVPYSWKEIHKQGMQLTLQVRNIFVSFRDIKSDPLKAQLAVSEFEKFSENWNDLMKDAIILAKNQGVELSL